MAVGSKLLTPIHIERSRACMQSGHDALMHVGVDDAWSILPILNTAIGFVAASGKRESGFATEGAPA